MYRYRAKPTSVSTNMAATRIMIADPSSQESSLCNHPHAIARTPTKEAYNAPFINIAVLMVFLLPENFILPFEWMSNHLCRTHEKHKACRSVSFLPLDRNRLNYWVSLNPLTKQVKKAVGGARQIASTRELSARRIAFSILRRGGARSCGTEVLVLQRKPPPAG